MAKKVNQKFYSLDEILGHDCRYNVLLGERSNGKSYAVKAHCLKEAYENGKLFAYLRRWREDSLRYLAEGYFNDMEETDDGIRYIEKLTHDKYSTVTVWNGAFYFANYDEKGNKKREGRPIGYLYRLTGETHFKSVAYVHVYNFIYEEFITNSGYLPDEPNKLMSMISTVLRRRKGRVFLVGNTMSMVCPYFSEWQLTNVLNQSPGTIDIYHYHTDQIDEDTGEQLIIDIAVENCENSGNNSQMFFGKRAGMTTSGKWDTVEQLHLSSPLEEHEILYTMYYEPDSLLKFKIQLIRHKRNDFSQYLYVTPCNDDLTKLPETTRIVSGKSSLKWGTTVSFLHYRTKYDKVVSRYIKEKQVCFPDNLTGTNFFNALKNTM